MENWLHFARIYDQWKVVAVTWQWLGWSNQKANFAVIISSKSTAAFTYWDNTEYIKCCVWVFSQKLCHLKLKATQSFPLIWLHLKVSAPSLRNLTRADLEKEKKTTTHESLSTQHKSEINRQTQRRWSSFIFWSAVQTNLTASSNNKFIAKMSRVFNSVF